MDNRNYPPPGQYPPGGTPATYSHPVYPANTTGIPATYSQPNNPHSEISFQKPAPPPSYFGNQGVTTTITVQPAYTGGVGVGPGPSQLVCPSCRATIISSVEYEPSGKTHLFALIFCLTGLWPCVCLPYCMDSCQSLKHYCPNCRAYLGSYSN